MNRLFRILLINNIRSKPVIYLLILIGMLISSTLLLIFGDLYFRSSSALLDQEFVTNRVTYVFYSKPDYQALASKVQNVQYINNAIYSCQRQSEDGITRISAYQNGGNLLKSRFLSGGIDKNVDEKNFICSSEYAQKMKNEKQIIIKVGTKISIDDQELVCSGIYLTNDFDILVSTNSMFKIEKALQYSFSYVFNNSISIRELDQISSDIQEEFNPVFTSYPQATHNFTLWGLLSELGPNLLLVLIAVVNYLFIYVFLIKKRFYSYSILKFCGLSASKTRLILLLESECLFIVSYFISIPVYLMISPLISGYSIVYPILSYQLLFSFFIMQVFNIIISLIATANIVSKNSIELLREGVVE